MRADQLGVELPRGTGEAHALSRPGAMDGTAGTVVAESVRLGPEAPVIGLELEADSEPDGPRVRGVPALRDRRPSELEGLRAEDLVQGRVQAGDRTSCADCADRRYPRLVELRPVAREARAREERRISPDGAEQRVLLEGLLAQMGALRPVGRELQGGDTVFVFGGEADPGLEPERPGDLLREEAADGVRRWNSPRTQTTIWDSEGTGLSYRNVLEQVAGWLGA